MTAAKNIDLARDLADGIASGRFAVGTLLPTEMALCEKYGASRYAVRKVLEDLQELGLISRRKNVGTRVEAARQSSSFTQSIATVDDLAQFGATHVRIVRTVGEVVVDAALAKALGCAAGSRWIRVSSLRMSGGKKTRPIGWTDVYVDASFTDIGELVRQSPGTLISEFVERRYGRRIARIQQDVSATSVPQALCEELKVEAHSPALCVVRRYLEASGEAFEISMTLHPERRFVLSSVLERSTPVSTPD